MIDPDDDTVYSMDASQCEDPVWLVKIPNYLFNEWSNVPDNSLVAKIVIADQSEKDKESSYKLISNPEFIADKEIPTINKFTIQGVNDKVNAKVERVKNLSIGSRDGKTFIMQSSGIESVHVLLKKPRFKKKALIGRVSVRCNVMPPNDTMYFAMKSKQIKTYNTPSRTTQAYHDPDIEFKPKSKGTISKKKDSGGRDGHRSARMDRSKLTDLICSHFEKHQFYNIKDLIELVAQPPGYVKEILKEVAQLSNQPSRRHMWELKPEYRHYS